MGVQPSKVSNREPGDTLLRKLAEDLLDSGNKLTIETVEVRYAHWSGATWRRLFDIHLEGCKKRHGPELFELKR